MEAQEKNPTAPSKTLYDAIFEICKDWMTIINEDGTPNKVATVEYEIRQMMKFAEQVSTPDLNPIIAAVCYYTKTAPSDEAKAAIKELQDLNDLILTISRYEDNIGVFNHAYAYWEDLNRKQAREEAAEMESNKEETAK